MQIISNDLEFEFYIVMGEYKIGAMRAFMGIGLMPVILKSRHKVCY